MAKATAKLDLAVIPARAGSVRLPGKNLRPLAGKPLIAWTVLAALSSGVFARVIVSTDGADIAAAARAAGAEVPFLRPSALSTPDATSSDVMRHALDACPGAATFALLQPTSPLRGARHIRDAATRFAQTGAHSLASVVRGKPLAWARAMAADGRLSPYDSLLDEAPVYPNGAIYLHRTATFLETGAFITRETIGFEMSALDSVDIDDAADFALAEALMAMREAE